MTIDEAIEILTRFNTVPYSTSCEELVGAHKLGIEAFKEVKKARYGDPALDGELLLGETEEVK